MKVNTIMNYVWIFGFVIGITYMQSTTGSNCSEALGMNSGAIADSRISASSQFTESLSAKYARLHKDIAGGAWCPKSAVEANLTEYLEINLGQTFLVTAVETQGRFGNGQGLEYSEFFYIYYLEQSNNNFSWTLYTPTNGSWILKGNVNPWTPQHQLLHPPIRTTQVRIVPYSEYPRIVCMRIELYGCLVKNETLFLRVSPGRITKIQGLTSSRQFGITEFVWIFIGIFFATVTAALGILLVKRLKKRSHCRYSTSATLRREHCFLSSEEKSTVL